ncbi:MAG: Mrp/NBP35 family ATP-binding protein [Elusimicrobiota bacterium]
MNIREIREKAGKRLEKVKNRILILSNKGGVGKTAVSVLLAQVLESQGRKVGLLDADIHGPSTVKALGMEGIKLKSSRDNNICPIEKANMKVLSAASLMEGVNTPLIWRGPMKSNLIRQFICGVEWGELDYLIIDSPPGTGDEPMSIVQMMDKIDGGVIVTTPQKIALLDARKCVSFLREMNVEALGLIENMSGFVCPKCGHESEIFNIGGGERAAGEMGLPFLGSLPLDMNVVQAMDKGFNYISRYPDSALSESLKEIVRKLTDKKET